MWHMVGYTREIRDELTSESQGGYRHSGEEIQ
jgi:hypothetical protein